MQSATKGHPARQQTEVIHTTEKHPFLITEDGFVTVANLVVGMHVVEGNGLVGWQVVAGTSVMYDLEVAQDHTFTVGNDAWVVHNCGDEIPWSSKSTRLASQELDAGSNSVTVASRSEAEEVFLNKYQGDGYRNTTGMSGPEAKGFFDGKGGTYHWDDNVDAEGRMQGHGIDNPHGDMPHLQIQQFTEDGGDIIRIFYP